MEWYAKKRATVVVEIDSLMSCIYHQTCVVQWDHKRVILNSGGFRTKTTKSHMNEVAKNFSLDFSVVQEKKKWYVRLPGCSWDELVPFFEGMEFSL